MRLSPTEIMVISILMDAALKQALKEVEGMTEEDMLAKITKQEARHAGLMAEIEEH